MLVMLDLDNTLGNRTEAVRLWAIEFCQQWALPDVAVEWILEQDNDGYSDRDAVFTAIRNHYTLPASVGQLLATYQQRVVELAGPTHGALACLRALRHDGHAIAIVSNGSTRQQHAKIDVIGFRPLVDAVIISGDLNIKKPDPRIFEAAATATGESLIDSWMVGDAMRNDVVGGHGVGAKTAWLHRQRQWSEPACEPTVTLDDLTQLSQALLAHV